MIIYKNYLFLFTVGSEPQTANIDAEGLKSNEYSYGSSPLLSLTCDKHFPLVICLFKT
jgi:hypothetical protein